MCSPRAFVLLAKTFVGVQKTIFACGGLFLICTGYVEAAPTNFGELIALPEGKINQVDIAKLNLFCAVGLPGAENLDVNAALVMLS